MPPLTNAVVVAPSKTLSNMVTSLETRVLNLQPQLLPVLARAGKPQGAQVVVAMPAPHPLDPHHLARKLAALGFLPIVSDHSATSAVKFQGTPDYQPLLNELTQGKPRPNHVIILQNGCTYTPDMIPETLPFGRHQQSWSMKMEHNVVDFLYEGQMTCISQRHLPDSGVVLISENDSSSPVNQQNDLISPTCTAVFRNLKKNSPIRTETQLYTRTQGMEWLWQVKAPLPFERWVKRYPLDRQAQLREAHQKVMAWGITNRDAIVKNFLKIETTTKFTDPRNISPRTDALLSVLGPYISAIEHQAIHDPTLVKGLNIKDRDKKLSWLAEYDAFIEIDFSRLDQTEGFDLLRDVQDVMLTTPFPESCHPLFHAALRAAHLTTGTSEFGTLYNVVGTRCSGDAHTSLGNGKLVGFSIWTCLRRLPIGSWRMVVEGDDVLIGVRRAYVNHATNALSFLYCLGLLPKINVFYDIHETTFCGRFFALTPTGVTSYCDPLRALSKFHTTTSQGDPKALLLAKALSYYAMDGATPVVGALCYALICSLRPLVSWKRLSRVVAYNRRHLGWNFLSSVNQGSEREAFHKLYHAKYTLQDTSRLMYAACLRTGWSFANVRELEQTYLKIINYGVPSSFPRIDVEWTFTDGKFACARIHELAG